MMANVLIDPIMLMLQDEDDIVNNIDFFRKIIALSNSRLISVCLYKEVLDQIISRQIYPFPVKINNIKDKGLKEKLLLLNASFTNSVMNNYITIDIDNCHGLQEFETDRKDLEEINEYYAFFGMLLTPCYSTNDIYNKILVGNKTNGLTQGEEVTISCNCENEEYERVYIMVSPDDFLTEQQKAVEKLRAIIAEKEELFVLSPQIKKGDHHNHIQSGDFNSYKELSAKNKRVFNSLRYLGLNRIIFTEFSPDASYEIGAVKIIKVEETADSDIVFGWFYGCLGFRILVELYFPKGIGYALKAYTNAELSKIKMDELLTELALY